MLRKSDKHWFDVMDMDLSIIIVNWNTKDLLDSCLDSIFSSTSTRYWEIIVVDNASTDGSAEMLEERHPSVRFIANDSNVGFARANNIGLKESSGRYVLFLNSDTLIRDNSIDRMLSYMSEHEDVSFLGPRLLNKDGSLQVSALRIPTLYNSIGDLLFGFFKSGFWSRFTTRYPSYDREINAGWLSGACLMCSGDSIKKLGGWPEEFFMYSEDVMLGVNAEKSGMRKVYFPDAEILHLIAGSTKDEIERIACIFENRIKLRRELLSYSEFLLYLFFAGMLLGARAFAYSLITVIFGIIGRDSNFASQKTHTYIKAFLLHFKALAGGL